MSRWAPSETKCLISIWGDVGIQQKFDGTVRDNEVYKEIKQKLSEAGIVRFTLTQIRSKIKNLKKKYRKDKDFIRKSENSYRVSKNYDQIDKVLGDKINSIPSAFLETSLATQAEGNSQNAEVEIIEVQLDVPLASNECLEKKAEGTLHTPEEPGRRIVDIHYFISQVQDFNKHGSLACTFSDMQVLSEERNGLNSGIKMKCRMCNFTKTFWTEDPQKTTMNVNAAAVTGIMNIGGNFSDMEKFFSPLKIPCMSENTFIEEQERRSVPSEVTTSLEEMKSAVSEEKSRAMQRGDVDSESINLPTIVGVESCAKGSFKTKHASLSGLSSGTTSKEEDKKTDQLLPLEPTIEIKEEPIDYDPTPSTSTEAANEEFILPHEENTWTPPVQTPPNPVVEPQFTLSVASLASPNTPVTSDGGQVGKKRKIKSSTFVPSTNGTEVRPESPVYNFGESSSPGSLKDPRKDQFDVFGEYIAAKLRSLDKRSCSYAQKAIGDIIFEAEMGKYLNEDSESKVATNSDS